MSLTRIVQSLFAWAALTLIVAPGAVAQEQDVTFISGDGETEIAGILALPDGEGPFPAVVMAHDCRGFRNDEGDWRPRDRFWFDHVRSLGYAVLLVDSHGPREIGDICRERRRPISAFEERAADLRGALAFLASRENVDAGNITLMGWNDGAIAALTATAQGDDGPDGVRSVIAFYPGCARLQEREYAAGVPVLMLLAKRDNWYRSGVCLNMAAGNNGRGAPMHLVVYPGAYHMFDIPDGEVEWGIARNNGWPERRGRHVAFGTDPAARTNSVQRVNDWLRRHHGEEAQRSAE